MNYRYCAWNFQYAGGGYFGETQAAPSWSGWVQLDVMRDGSARTVIAYHHDAGGGYYSWIDIDSANGSGSWPFDPRPIAINDHIWPKFTVCSNNNILLATGDYADFNLHHLYITTDFGLHWDSIVTFDSCSNLDFFLRASRINGSNKVVFVHTQFIDDSIAAGQLDHNVWYMLSNDNGASWTSRINVTDYQPYPIDSVRAYADVNANFDRGDNLHIVWAGRRVADAYYKTSKIFHWDEIHDTITVVSSPSIYYNEPGGWWIQTATAGQFGGWRMPADRPALVVDTLSDFLYCIWHGNDDYNDYSAAGYINGELYGAYSTDNGLTWSDYTNLTNTRTPGAGPGYCDDEDYATVHPYVINDSIWVTYIEDKDAGNYADAEGTRTSNPVRCWVFPTSLITGITERKDEEPAALSLHVVPNPFTAQTKIAYCVGRNASGEKIRIYDASGRLVKSFPRLTPDALRTTLLWPGDDQHGTPVPAGVYFITLTAEEQNATVKVVKLE
jgi:hypothetical protein